MDPSRKDLRAVARPLVQTPPKDARGRAPKRKARMSALTLEEFRQDKARQEAQLVRKTLAQNKWSLTHAAKQLGVTPGTLRAMLKAHGLFDEYQRCNPGRGRPKK